MPIKLITVVCGMSHLVFRISFTLTISSMNQMVNEFYCKKNIMKREILKLK